MNVRFEEDIIKINLPANCVNGEEKYYSMSLEGEIRSCSILYFNCFWANRELILWKNSEMLSEAFAWPWLKEKLYGSLKEKSKFWIKTTIRKSVKVKQPVLWCLDGYSTGGYFHWITDILPRLWMAKEYLPEIHFAIPDYFFQKWSFCKEFFDLLGVENFLILRNQEKYLIDNLVLPTRAGNPFYLQPVPIKEGVKWLQEAGLKRSSITFAERIYISRAKATWRRVTNEEELYPVLEKFGFKIIHFEDLSISDQISICNNANVILGLHGAGLTNLVFMKPGSKIIEIRPRNVSHMYTCFFTLCPYFDCEYNYILCDYAAASLHTEKQIEDHSVILSIQELDSALSKIL